MTEIEYTGRAPLVITKELDQERVDLSSLKNFSNLYAHGLTMVMGAPFSGEKGNDFLIKAKKITSIIEDVLNEPVNSIQRDYVVCYHTHHMHATVGAIIGSDYKHRNHPLTSFEPVDISQMLEMLRRANPFSINLQYILITPQGEILVMGEASDSGSAKILCDLRKGLKEEAKFKIRYYDMGKQVHVTLGYIKEVLPEKKMNELTRALELLLEHWMREDHFAALEISKVRLVHYGHRSLRDIIAQMEFELGGHSRYTPQQIEEILIRRVQGNLQGSLRKWAVEKLRLWQQTHEEEDLSQRVEELATTVRNLLSDEESMCLERALRGEFNICNFADDGFTRKIGEFITKDRTLVDAQRSIDEEQATKIAREALAGIYCKLKDLGTDWRKLSQKGFDELFGVRQIVMAAGLGTRYSLLIHKAMATGGTGWSNIELAMKGSFGSPTIAPLVLVNPKILGLIVKGKYLRGYDEKTGSFKIKKDTLKMLEYQLIDSNSEYIDRDLMRRYFGWADVLLCYIPILLGPGGDLLKSVKILDERGYKSPFVQVVFGEMSTSVLPEYTNASLVAYLKILGGDYLAVAGGKGSSGEIEYKGNFAFDKGRLVAYEDWEKIPHGKYKDKEEWKPYDRVLEQHGKDYKRVRDKVTQIRKQYERGELDDREMYREVQILRKEYPYFVISGEGELFNQERLQEIRDRLKNWLELADKEKEYIKRNFAVRETNKKKAPEADLMISANVGIFRMDTIARFCEELMEEFEELGYREYHEARKGRMTKALAWSFFRVVRSWMKKDRRQAGRFWGVDWKSGMTKALAWSFFRVFRDRWLREYPGEDVPLGFVDVTGAPSSIKDAKKQFAFTSRYIDEYGVREETRIGARWLEIIKGEKGELERELLGLLKNDKDGGSNIDFYRKVVNGLFLMSKDDARQQIKVLTVLKEIEEMLGRKKNKHISFSLELIRGFHRNAIVEAIDRDYFDRDLIGMMTKETVREIVMYYFSPLYNHSGSGYIKVKLDLLRTTHDVRPILREKIINALKSSKYEYYLREGGFASIDINIGMDKKKALEDFVENMKIDLEASIYFGDEFHLTGNDMPIARLKEGGKNSGFRIISVGLTHPTGEVEGVGWVGGGPERTKVILKKILKGLEECKDIVIDIKDHEKGIQAKMDINVQRLKEKGGLIFDVDGTLLSGKERTFGNDRELRNIFKKSLQKGIKIGIISGNSRVEQNSRIVSALKKESHMEGLVLYANGGATRVYGDKEEEWENIGDPIPEKDLECVKKVVEEFAGEQFGLVAGELMAWKDFYRTKNGIGGKKGFPVRDASWMNKGRWTMDVVRAEDIKEKKKMSCPWLEIRDGVQATIKLLPKKLEIQDDFKY